MGNARDFDCPLCKNRTFYDDDCPHSRKDLDDHEFAIRARKALAKPKGKNGRAKK